MQRPFSSEQRLKILRSADHERKWYSLDDQRACVMCDRLFTGRQVEIVRNQGERFLLKCPTEGCLSRAAHWFYAGNAATAAVGGLHKANWHDRIRPEAAARSGAGPGHCRG